MQFDPPNVEIIRHLKDGLKSTKEIRVCREAGHWQPDKMAKDGILEGPGLVNANILSNTNPMIIGLNVHTAAPKIKTGQMDYAHRVIASGIVIESFDVTAWPLVKHGRDMICLDPEAIFSGEGVQYMKSALRPTT